MQTKILVIRNDKLGDFMLAWPALACLKAADPALHVSVLVPAYTRPLAESCPWIDGVIADPGEGADGKVQRDLLRQVNAGRFDAQLTLFSTPRIGWLGWRAGIALRLAPATKWAQLFYNHRIAQRRSRSEKPEYLYNMELAEALLERLGYALPRRPEPPFWPLPSAARHAQQARLTGELGLDTLRPRVFVHAGSGGSAVNLSPQRYGDLILAIEAHCRNRGIHPPAWVLTAGPEEHGIADALCHRLRDEGLDAHRQPPTSGLDDFAHLIAAADLFIAGSTGPLHIAGCLNVATAGFYPARRSATPLRWQTCNDGDRRLAFSPPAGAGERDMGAIDLNDAAERITRYLQRMPTSETTP